MDKERLDFEIAVLIAGKKEKGVGPFTANALELASAVPNVTYGEIVHAMRELAREGKYKPSVTINKIPILIPL